MCLNNSKSEDSKPETDTSETRSNINKVIIFVVYVFVSIMIGIIGIAVYKTLNKKKGKTKMQTDEILLTDFLSKEKLTIRHVRCIIVGCSGAGKTTLLRRLQNAKFNDLKNVKTTELIEVHESIFDVSENENTIQSVHTENKLPFSTIMDAIKELSKDNPMCPRITFLDFAGQSIYYAFQQIYFSPKTCYILVFDMTKKPNEHVHETDGKCCSLFESWAYKEYYKFWFKLIDSYSDIDSPAIIVGTHAEHLSKQDSERIFKEFFALFKNHPYIQRHLNMARTFAIGFPRKGSKLADIAEIKTCVADIVRVRGYSYQIQRNWALFEYLMHKMKRQRIVSRTTVSEINDMFSKEHRLNDEDITEMLLFLHRVGSLLYFDEDILKKTIILDVQWFVDAFKSIIEYREDRTNDDQNSSRFKITGELTDQELTAIWKSNDKGHTYIFHKLDVLSYMEHFGLVAICNAQHGELPLYYFPSMNTRRFKNESNNFTKSSILCFQFNEDGQLPFNMFYLLVVKCLKIPKWSILQEYEQNCWYENVACFSYGHCIVVVCLCKFQIQLQVWNPEINGLIEPELLGDIQLSVEKKLSKEKYLTYKIGYKCYKGTLNAEEDKSFIAQTQFPVSKLNCPSCALENKHHVDNKICWVLPERSEDTQTDKKELCAELYNLLSTECLKLTREVMTATITREIGKSAETLLENLTDQDKSKLIEILPGESHRIIESQTELGKSFYVPYGLLRIYLDKKQSPKSGWGNPVKGTDIGVGDDIERLFRIQIIVQDIAKPDSVSVENYIGLLDKMIKSLTRLDPNDEFMDEIKAFALKLHAYK